MESAGTLDIERQITAYEERYELPVYRGREGVIYGLAGLWAVASVGMAFYAFRKWEAEDLPFSFSDLYERNWTRLEKSAIVGYTLVSGLGLYRETFAEWHAQQIARDNHQEREYGLLVSEVAVHLNKPQNDFKHTKTRYLKRELYDDAMEYRDREDIKGYLANLTFEACYLEGDLGENEEDGASGIQGDFGENKEGEAPVIEGDLGENEEDGDNQV